MDVAASGALVWAGCIMYLEYTQVHNIYIYKEMERSRINRLERQDEMKSS
jgi:hypothetical protein